MVFDAPYRNRPIWPIEVVNLSGWQIKFYGMCAVGAGVKPTLINTAREFLIDSARFDASTGYGFSILHRGEEAIWLLLDWWEQDILHQRLFWSDIDGEVVFHEGPPKNELACVWELQVIAHERDAWVKHVMTDPTDADYNAYLLDQLGIEA